MTDVGPIHFTAPEIAALDKVRGAKTRSVYAHAATMKQVVADTPPPPPPPDTQAPSVPTGLTASLSGSTALLTWTPSTDNVATTAYVIMRNGQVAGTSKTPGFSVSVDLTVAQTITFTVAAMDAAGNTSAPSAPASVTITPPPPPPPPPSVLPPAVVPWASSAKLIFQDEFDGDLSKWYVLNNFKGWDSAAQETYMTPQVSISNGTLKLVAVSVGPNQYHSGAITTRGEYGGGPDKFAFKYGYCETRQRFPKGGGYWPAFWLVGAAGTPAWPAYGEFDIVEWYGTYPSYYEATTHWVNGSGSDKQQGGQPINYPAGTTAQDWHTYGLLWEPSKLSYILDGQVVQTFTPADSGAQTALGYFHTMILNLAVGGSGPSTYHQWDGTWNFGDLPGTVEVDYVRAWQQ